MQYIQFKAAAAAFVTLLAQPMLAGPALAQVESRDIGAWYFNDSGESCAISRQNDAGALTMINDGGGNAALAFFDKTVGGVAAEQERALQLRINGSEPIDVTGVGITSEGSSGYFILLPVEVFAENPMNGRMDILRDGQVVHYFALDGLQPAAQALVSCVKKYQK